MVNENYDDDLWDEIPYMAFIPLGRRGREKIILHQCFIPKCGQEDSEKVHAIKKIEEVKDLGDSQLESTKYLIECEVCKEQFHLVFERHVDKAIDPEEVDEKIIMERVFATSGDDKTNYGEIGFVQLQ